MVSARNTIYFSASQWTFHSMGRSSCWTSSTCRLHSIFEKDRQEFCSPFPYHLSLLMTHLCLHCYWTCTIQQHGLNIMKHTKLSWPPAIPSLHHCRYILGCSTAKAINASCWCSRQADHRILQWCAIDQSGVWAAATLLLKHLLL